MAMPEPTPQPRPAAPTRLPDDHLVRMAQRDPATFVHLYDRYVEPIYRYCRRSLTPEQAEDATSITFLNALRALNRFDPDRASFRAWLYTIAHHALIDQTRDRHHDQIDDIWLDDGSPLLEDHIVALDERDRLQYAIRQLPPDQFAVVSLRLAGLTGPEIAAVVGKRHDAIRGLQYRAMKRLRVLLSPPVLPDLERPS